MSQYENSLNFEDNSTNPVMPNEKVYQLARKVVLGSQSDNE